MEENLSSEGMEKRGPGQPKAKIDWEKVDALLMAGCSGREIASNIGLNPNTLYSRCEIDNGIEFSEYSRQKHEKGESRLRAHQYAKALGLTDKGDNTLLIFLGKVRLKQREITIEEQQKLIMGVNYGPGKSDSVEVLPEEIPAKDPSGST